MYNSKTGRQLTDKERQAMFFYMNSARSVPKLTLKKKKSISDKSNRFAAGGLANLEELNIPEVDIPQTVQKSSAIGSGVTVAVATGNPVVGGAVAAATETSNQVKQVEANVSKTVKKVGVDTIKTSANIVSGVGGVASNLGADLASDTFGPRAYTNSELASIPDIWQVSYPVPEFSESPISYSLDVETARAAIKKQYPEADVNTDVTVLPPDKYMETALKKNPGREDEAMRSNGFYSPSDDKTYIEYDQDKLNTLRALLHEFVHDMSDEGVDNVQLNEGYADYVAYKIMTQEIKIPEGKAKLTLGYPKEMSKIAKLVQDNGREKVDEAFLKDHNLKKLDVKLDF